MKTIDSFRFMLTSLSSLTDNISNKFHGKNVIIFNVFLNTKTLKIIYHYKIVQNLRNTVKLNRMKD